MDKLDSIHAIENFLHHGRDCYLKTHQGYFTSGGWAYETLKKLKEELEGDSWTDVKTATPEILVEVLGSWPCLGKAEGLGGVFITMYDGENWYCGYDQHYPNEPLKCGSAPSHWQPKPKPKEISNATE